MLGRFDKAVDRSLRAVGFDRPEVMPSVDRESLRPVGLLGFGVFGILAYLASKGVVTQTSNMINGEPFSIQLDNPLAQGAILYANTEWARINITISGCAMLGSAAVSAASARLLQRCTFGKTNARSHASPLEGDDSD